MKRRLTRWVGMVSGVVATSMAMVAPAYGLSIRRSLMERIRSSDAIVRATVVSEQSLATPVRGLPMVYTDVRLRVGQYLKTPNPTSSQSPEILIRVPGGITSQYSLTIEEVPTFKAGEEIIVFVKSWPDHPWQLVDGHDGKYLVVKDPSMGKKVIRVSRGHPISLEDAKELGLSLDETELLSTETFLRALNTLIRQTQPHQVPHPSPSSSPTPSPSPSP